MLSFFQPFIKSINTLKTPFYNRSIQNYREGHFTFEKGKSKNLSKKCNVRRPSFIPRFFYLFAQFPFQMNSSSLFFNYDSAVSGNFKSHFPKPHRCIPGYPLKELDKVCSLFETTFIGNLFYRGIGSYQITLRL